MNLLQPRPRKTRSGQAPRALQAPLLRVAPHPSRELLLARWLPSRPRGDLASIRALSRPSESTLSTFSVAYMHSNARGLLRWHKGGMTHVCQFAVPPYVLILQSWPSRRGLRCAACFKTRAAGHGEEGRSRPGAAAERSGTGEDQECGSEEEGRGPRQGPEPRRRVGSPHPRQRPRQDAASHRGLPGGILCISHGRCRRTAGLPGSPPGARVAFASGRD